MLFNDGYKKNLLIIAVSFSFLGGLTGSNITGSNFWIILLCLLTGTAVGTGWLKLYCIIMFNINKKRISGKTRHDIEAIVFKAYLVFIPFIFLAFVSEVFMHWNTIQAFTFAGLTTGGTAAGLEITSLSKKPLSNMLLTTLSTIILAIVWMTLSFLAKGLGGV